MEEMRASVPTNGILASTMLNAGERSLRRKDSWTSMMTQSKTTWMTTTRRIAQLHQGRDGLTRSATVRTAGGELARPVQRLYTLEMADFQCHRDRNNSSACWHTFVGGRECCEMRSSLASSYAIITDVVMFDRDVEI